MSDTKDENAVSTRVFDTFEGTIVSDIEPLDIKHVPQFPVNDHGPIDQYSFMEPNVARMLRRPRIRQHTPEWRTKRKLMITATNIAAITGQSPWESRNMLFKRKTGQKEPTAKNFAMEHGIFYEPEAMRVFSLVTGIALYNEDIGLMEHPQFDWIGASPDGVAMYYPWLIEIKCPQKTQLVHECPRQYYTQIQLQLEVCDLPVCFLVQYSPPDLPLSKGSIDILRIERDRQWWVDTLPPISQFWTEVLSFYAHIGKPVGEQTVDWDEHKALQKRKRQDRKVRCSIVRTPNRTPQVTPVAHKIMSLD